ncbi:MAG: hypothetical protein ACKV22_25875 [Bryobacteraceae bacterium]
MPFCQNCGAEVTGRFCGKCGTPMAAEGAPSAGFPAQPQANYSAPPAQAGAGLTDNVAGALCYLVGLVTGIIFLLIAPYNQNKKIRFHAFQAIFLHLAVIVLSIGLSILGFITSGFAFMLYPIIWLGALVVWVYIMVMTYQDKRISLPIIGPLAEKQA